MPQPTSHRLHLARAPRGLRRRTTRVFGTHVERTVRQTLKRSALRDCGRRCVYCAAPLAPETATLDHVYPSSRGGPNVPGNLVSACAPCNRMKGDMLPTEFFLLYPWAGQNFMRYARCVHRSLKRGARRAVSLAMAA